MNGISFIVRSRNEAVNLNNSLNSLRGLRIPFEINVILHLCVDSSRQILENLKPFLPVKIHEYNKEVSRAGYETFITPVEHENSFVTYSKFCFNTSNYKWKFRWDSDFFATKELIEFLNSLDLSTNRKIRFKIPCELGDTGILNEEIYLSNCLIDISKYMFWENYIYEYGSEEMSLRDVCKIQSVSYKNLKDYWIDRTPWFVKSNNLELTTKYNDLVSRWGPEPAGMARASNPEADKFIALANI